MRGSRETQDRAADREPDRGPANRDLWSRLRRRPGPEFGPKKWGTKGTKTELVAHAVIHRAIARWLADHDDRALLEALDKSIIKDNLTKKVTA